MIDEKLRRLASWARGREAPPFTLDLNPTDKCNLRCLSCWQRAEQFESLDSSYELPGDKLVRLVREAISLGVCEFEITGGGEPWMRRDVVLRIAQLVKRHGRFGNITTNGTLFSQTDVEELVRLGWDRITFSLDGPDPQTNDWLRGSGTFRRIVQVIRWFNRWKARLGLTRPTLKLNTVISKKNYDKLPEMIRLAHQLGCKIVSFESLTVHSALGKRLKLPKPAQADGYLRLAAQLAQKWGIYTNAAGFLTDDFLGRSNRMVQILKENGLGVTGLASSPCFEPWWHLVIKVDGSAQPCCLYDAKEENVKRSSLAHIWTGRFFRRVRAEMASHHLSHYCQICNAGQVMENRRIRAELTSLLGGLGG